MRLERPNKDLIQILINPLDIHGQYGNYNRYLYFLSKLILKLGVPFKNKHLVHNLILGTFLKVAKAANFDVIRLTTETVSQASRVSKSIYTDPDKARLDVINKMRQYFAVEAFLEDSECEQLANLVDKYVETHKLSIYESTNSRISEKLNLNLDNQHLLPNYPNLWFVFYFSEFIYFFLINQYEARVSHKKLFLFPKPELAESFRRYWFAAVIEFNSCAGDLLTLKSKDHFMHYSFITLENSEEIVEILLDKVFSLRSQMLSEKLQQSMDLITLKEIILFAACVEIASYTVDDIPESFFRHKTSIRHETINKLISVIQKRRKNSSISALSNFVVYEDRFFKRGNQQFKFGLKKLAGIVLEESLTELKDPKGDIGKSFEADYILNYLKSLNFFGYESYGVFKPSPAARIRGYDIDVILKDKKENLFFFIQVKYWFNNLPIHLDEKIKFFNGNDVRDKVFRQLVKLKENIEEEEIRNKLLDLGLEDARKDNSYFILLHNVPFLNFYEYAGVIFYEWNSFRNLLQQGRVFATHFEGGREKSLSQTNATERIPIHKPSELIDRFLTRDDLFGQSMSANWVLHNRILNSFTLRGVDFVIRDF